MRFEQSVDNSHDICHVPLSRARMMCAAIVCAHIAYVSDFLRSECLYSGCLRSDLASPDCVCFDDHALIVVLVSPAL